ncbi:hypothetical protein [Serratia phage SP1]|nr:hypothetical protein [Serratia phage SP1]
MRVALMPYATSDEVVIMNYYPSDNKVDDQITLSQEGKIITLDKRQAIELIEELGKLV